MNENDARYLINAVEAIPKALEGVGLMVEEAQVDSIMAEVARIVAVSVIAITGDAGKPLTKQAKAELVKMARLEG